jgi:hypothetical protein
VPLLDTRANTKGDALLAEVITEDGCLDLKPAVAFLLTSCDSWLKRSGIEAVAACELHSLSSLLESCAADSNLVVREAAGEASGILRAKRSEGDDND